MNHQTNIGHTIRDLRKRSGWTQEKLELEMQTGYGSISKIETGQVNPTKETLNKIAKLLKLNAFDVAALYGMDVVLLAQLVSFSTTINVLDLQQVLAQALEVVETVFNYPASFICLRHGDELTFDFLRTPAQKIYNRIMTVPLSKLRLSLVAHQNTLLAQCVLQASPVYSEVASDFVSPMIPKRISNLLQLVAGVKSDVAMPLIYQEEVLGVILFGRNKVGDYESELPLLAAFCELVATAIYNAKKYANLETLVTSK